MKNHKQQGTKIETCGTPDNNGFSSDNSFFFYLGFLSRTFTIHKTAGEGEGICLPPLYHFLLLHRHLGISQAIYPLSYALFQSAVY